MSRRSACSTTNRDDDRLRAALLVGLGDAQRQTGHPGFRETLLAAGRLAQQVGDTDTLVAAALANNRGFSSVSLRVDADRVAIIEAALAAVGDADSTARARLLSLLALERMYDGDYPARRAIADEALAMARRLGDPATLLDVLLRRHVTITDPDTLAERLAETAEAEALADRLGDPVGRFWSASSRMTPAIESADLAEFTRCVDKQTALADQIGQPTLRWLSTCYQSVAVLLAGDAERAEALADRSLRHRHRDRPARRFPGTTARCGPIRWHQGRSGEQIDVAEAAAADHPELPAIRAALARMYADAGRDGDARRLVAAETAEASPVPTTGCSSAVSSIGRKRRPVSSDRVASEMLYERLAPWPDQVVSIGIAIHGALAHYLGHLATVLGRYDTAETHFTKALAIHERLQAPFHLARTHLEWGRMLHRPRPTRRRETPPGASGVGPDLAHRYGCTLVEQRATELLRQL